MTDASRAVLPDPKEALDDSWEGAIHELLAEQARRSPESLAIVDENQSWTYDETNRCANRLAHCLIDSGIRPKDLIAIYAHRSSSLIVALFGILKAGASFLILDPAYPAARTIDYLRIAQPKGWLQLEGSGELPDERTELSGQFADALPAERPTVEGGGFAQPVCSTPTPNQQRSSLPMIRRTSLSPPAPPASRRAYSAAMVPSLTFCRGKKTRFS